MTMTVTITVRHAVHTAVLPGLPTYALDPAEVRRYVQQHPTRVFNIYDPRRCLLASLLRERHGDAVIVDVNRVWVNEQRFHWEAWTSALQERLMGQHIYWYGADILPVLDQVLAAYGIVVDEPRPAAVEIVPVSEDTVAPAPAAAHGDRFVHLAAAWHAVLERIRSLLPSPPAADAGDDTTIVAPTCRARRRLVTRLPGTPDHDQVDDRRPAVYRHLVE